MTDSKDRDVIEEWSVLDRQLEKLGQSHRRMTMPADLELSIERGIQFAKQRRKRKLRGQIGILSVTAVVLLFLLGVRVSPVVATAVSQIPGMAYLVELVRGDRGLELALQHDFIQPIHISDEHDGIRFTVEGVIADEHRIVILYLLESLDEAGLQISDIKVKDADSGEALSSYSYNGGDLEGQVDIWIGDGEAMPKRIMMEIGAALYPRVSADGAPLSLRKFSLPEEWRNVNLEPDGIWRVTFAIDHAAFAGMAETYHLDHTVTVSEQSFSVKKAVIYPTGVSVEIVNDPHNEMEIFGVNGLKLVNEAGEEYRMYGRWNEQFYFESPYFMMPEKLYLEGVGIRALPKDQLEVEVDLERQQIVKAPDERLSLQHVSEQGDAMEFIFHLNHTSEAQIHNIFDFQFRDESGQIYEMLDGSFVKRSSVANYSEHIVRLPKANYEGNLFLHIYHYPHDLAESFRVRIK